MDSSKMNKKVAVITGGSEGIGLAAAHALADQGYQVILVGRRQEKLDAATKDWPAAKPLAGDMGKDTEVAELVRAVDQQFGRIDALVHAAGSFLSKPLADTTFEDWHNEMRNLYMLFHVNKAVSGYMAEHGGGVIVNVASRAGLREEVLPGSTAYGAVKGGMVNFSAALRQEVADTNVQVAVICPGLVDTKMGRAAIAGREGLDNGLMMAPSAVGEAIAQIIAQAPHQETWLWRLTKEDGLQAVDQRGWS